MLFPILKPRSALALALLGVCVLLLVIAECEPGTKLRPVPVVPVPGSSGGGSAPPAPPAPAVPVQPAVPAATQKMLVDPENAVEWEVPLPECPTHEKLEFKAGIFPKSLQSEP